MSTTNRTDIHRPAEIDPADYAFIEAFYQGASDEMHDAYQAEHRFLEDTLGELWHETTVPGGNYNVKRTCDHCGAAFAHGALYRHEPTGELIAVGHICAAHTMLPGVDKAARSRKAAERAAKAAKAAKANEVLRAEILDANPGLAEAFQVDHYIITDIKRRFLSRYPELSEKQIALVLKLAAEAPARAAKLAADADAARPVIEGKAVVVEGEILTTKVQYGDYGSTLKMLVLDDRGFKVWGTVPSAVTATRGDRIRFTASTEASRDDETFGFFKRPRLAEILTVEAA